jgi:serine/threonine protein kinase
MAHLERKTKKTSSDSKRHYTVVIGNKEHGLYVSSTPSSAAKKAVTKLCGANKSKKVEFHIREITQGSKKKTYGPYNGYIEKLKEPIELKGRVIQYKPFAKLSGKKGGMMGGGYNASLTVNKNINDILKTTKHDTDNTLIFTITNNQTFERIEYINNRCLGEGGYGKVFLVINDGKNYVIKLTQKNLKVFLKEPYILNSFMKKIGNDCQYKAISQGETVIQEVNIGHIIFPFKGDIDLYEVIFKKYFKLIPEILRDVISCLIDINRFACHGDLRLENIVYDQAKKRSFIIDYGLSFLFPLDINELEDLTIGNKQISFEIIIAYLLKIKKNNRITFSLYSQYRDFIQNTIDNFGLFWIILESISIINIFKNFFEDDTYLIIVKEETKFNDYLNFYFNLDYNVNSTEFGQKIKKLFNYSPHPEFTKKFIEYIRHNISPEKFSFYFNNNEQLYISFIEKVLALVRIDPTTRISKEILLQDPFFPKKTKLLLPNIPNRLLIAWNNLPNKQIRLPSVNLSI